MRALMLPAIFRFATTYLSAALFPLVLAYSLRSLIYDKHLSWYSWAIGAATSCVYTFGFVLMCPQLYINHKLKSVSHLPWNVSHPIAYAAHALYRSRAHLALLCLTVDVGCGSSWCTSSSTRSSTVSQPSPPHLQPESRT